MKTEIECAEKYSLIDRLVDFSVKVVKSLPLGAILSGFVFWIYLFSIGRSDLFIPSLSDAPGMAAFLSCVLALSVILVFCFLFPSFIFVSLFKSIEDKRLVLFKENYPNMFFGVILGQLLSLFLMLVQKEWAIFGIVAGALVNLAFLWKKDKNIVLLDGELKNIWYPVFLLVAMGVCGLVSMISVSLFVFPAIGNMDNKVLPIFTEAMLIFLVVGITNFPAYIYCKSEVSLSENKKPVENFLIGAAIVLVTLFLFLLPAWGGIVFDRSAVLVGIGAKEIGSYGIKPKKLPLDTLDAKLWKSDKKEDYLVVQGFLPFVFGNKVLICPDSRKIKEELRLYSKDFCIVLESDEIFRIPKSFEYL